MKLLIALCVLASDPEVSRTVRDMEQEVRHALSAEGTAADLAAVIDRYLDFEQLSAYALDPQWQDIPPKKQKRFVELLRDVVVLQTQLRVKRPTNFEVNVERQNRAGEYVAVLGVLNPADPDPTALAVTFFKRGPRWRVVDVAIDGSSVARSYRAELFDVLNQRGLAALFSTLLSRRQSLRKESRGKL